MRFANRYGWLGIGEQFHIDLPTTSGRKRRVATKAEGLNNWREEIQTLIFAQHLRECVSEEHTVPLSRYFKWDAPTKRVLVEYGVLGRDILGYGHKEVRRRIKSFFSDDKPLLLKYDKVADGEYKEPHEYHSWRKDEVLGPARLYLAQLINWRIENHTSSRAMIDGTGTLRSRVTPWDLLGAIWLQFHQVVAGEIKLRRCEICGNFLDVTGRRSTKRMHSSCQKREQMKRFRAKKRQRGSRNVSVQETGSRACESGSAWDDT